MHSRIALGLCLSLAVTSFAANTDRPAAGVTNRYISARVALDHPGFDGLSLDSLGKEQFALVRFRPPAGPRPPAQATQDGARVEYRRPGAFRSAPPRWAIEIGEKEIRLESRWSAEDPPEPLVLEIENSRCHVTLLGRMNPDGSIQLPAIMHFPDQGSFRISTTPKTAKSSQGTLGHTAQSAERGEDVSSRPFPAQLGPGAGGTSPPLSQCPMARFGCLGYETGPGDMAENQAKAVKITFPAATADNPVVKYRWEVVAIHPEIRGIDADVRFDGFRRNWLNILQISPHWRTLANHAASDTCAFCYYEYADVARYTPPLAENLTALEPVRQTLERIIGGANAYGMPGHGAFPEFSADSLPSLLIAADDYVAGSKDEPWLAAHYPALKSWADKMLATDRGGNGLIEYTLSGNSGSWPAQLKYRPANWWDTIGFGHEDAYANALAYRALQAMEDLAQQSGQTADQQRYRAAADKLRAAYFDAFYNPATGVLAGWRSADGQQHDYYFLWVNGIAIHYGLVPKDEANAIMDRLMAKIREVGYTRFDLGLPGNLVPVAKKDYVDHNPRFGGGVKEDNSDGFQRYENGGATACFAYFTLAALYDLGRIEQADRILFPLLEAFAKGSFQGRGANGMSNDWRAWDGTCWGYEGFLVDNYYALLAVLDRQAALKRAGISKSGR